MKPRIRSIKPEVLLDEVLWDLGVETGFPILQAFEGLWMYADREGRFEWRPRALKPGILPYWEGDFSRVLDALASRRFVVRYECDGRAYGVVRTFKKHQVINNREAESVLPAPPPEALAILSSSTRGDHDGAREDHASGTREGPALVEGKGRERKGREREPCAREGLAPEFVAVREFQAVPELLRISEHEFHTWRKDWAWIGSRPDAERAAAHTTLARSAWAKANPHQCHPGHIRKHWLAYSSGKEPVDRVAVAEKPPQDSVALTRMRDELAAMRAEERALKKIPEPERSEDQADRLWKLDLLIGEQQLNVNRVEAKESRT